MARGKAVEERRLAPHFREVDHYILVGEVERVNHVHRATRVRKASKQEVKEKWQEVRVEMMAASDFLCS